MFSKNTITAFLIYILLPGCLLAQQYNFKTYSVNKGLPQAQVHDIEQTRDGYIWMSTYGGGLVRFDGKQFETYTEEDGLKSNTVEHVLVDSNDQVWISTAEGGVMSFQGDSLIYPIDSDTLNHYDFTALVELKEGRKGFGTFQGGAFIYDGQSLFRMTTKDGLVNNTVWDIFEDENGEIWLGTSNGISIYDGNTFENYTIEDGLSGTKVYEIIEIDGKKWIATNNGISIWEGGEFRHITELQGKELGAVFNLMLASDGKVWVATYNNGVFTYREDKVVHYTEENGLSSNYAYALFEDHNKNIWIGTDGNGVNIFKDQGFTFYNESFGLSNSSIYSVYRDREGTLWLGAGKGLESFDGKSFKTHKLPEKYSRGNIWSITGLPNGDKLLGMPDNTLMRYDGNSFSNFSETYDLEKVFVYDIQVEADSVAWIASQNGLYSVELETKEVRHFTVDDGLASDVVTEIFIDQEGAKWIGTRYGLSVFEDGVFQNTRVRDGLVDNQIYHVTEGPEHNIWLGTGGGISIYRPDEDNSPLSIENFDEDDGMKLVNTHFIWFDQKGYLWQGTNGGLQMLDVPTYRETGNMTVTHYPLSNTGLGREFNFHAFDMDSSQNVWMGSMEGVVRFNPNDNTRKLSSPDLKIVKLNKNGVSVNWQTFSDSVSYHNGEIQMPSVTFPSGSNTYEIIYQGLCYLNSGNMRYRYKLEGFDQDWRPVTTDNSAIFTNLDPGNYTFVVQAKNGQSSWEANRASYSFTIAAPFWQTYWFYSLVALIVGGVTYSFGKYRLNKWEKEELQKRVDKQTEHLTKALEEKEVLIKEIHHRVKNNLAVISGLLELQMDNAEDNFVDRVLTESQRRVQSISMIHEKLYQNEHLAEIDFEKYVQELVDIVIYSLDKPDKDITVNIDIDDFKLGIDQGIPCGLILNEVVSNAFEHAFSDQDKGQINIAIHLLDDHKLRLTVEDNGQGIPEGFEKNENDSLGITLVETLGDQLMGEVKWQDTGNGTQFSLEFIKEEPSVQIPI